MNKSKEKIIVYQVLPRLFGNTKATNMVNGSVEENGVGKMSAFSSRVLQAIKEMGFTHIWYTGLLEHATQTDYSGYGIRNDHPSIVKGKAGSPYAVKDYYDIDPDLADNVPDRMKEFEALIERTHQAGLKMIMDFVPNHVARQYHSDAKPKGVVDLGENDNRSVHFDRNNNFYYFPGQNICHCGLDPQSPEKSTCHCGLDPQSPEKRGDYVEFPAKATGNDCFSAHPNKNDWYETIKLNYGIDYLNRSPYLLDSIPDTWFKMLGILRFWAAKNIDGFRCDMAEMVPVEFWEWLIPQLKQDFPHILFIAEVYDPEQYRNYIHKGKFDYLYNKVGLYDCLRAITCGHQPASAITSCWQSVDDIHAQMLNFLENHDEQRIASDFFSGDARKAIPALVVSATLFHNPLMIYAGQELGEKGMDAEGFSGLDGRTTIFDYWSVESLRNWYNHGKINTEFLSPEQKKLRNFYIEILLLCNNSIAIREGKFFDLMYVNPHSACFNPNKQYAFMRFAGDELLLIAVNFDEKDVDIKINLPELAFSYFGINEQNIASVKELFTQTYMDKDLIKRDFCFSTHIKKRHASIICCKMKKMTKKFVR